MFLSNDVQIKEKLTNIEWAVNELSEEVKALSESVYDFQQKCSGFDETMTQQKVEINRLLQETQYHRKQLASTVELLNSFGALMQDTASKSQESNSIVKEIQLGLSSNTDMIRTIGDNISTTVASLQGTVLENHSGIDKEIAYFKRRIEEWGYYLGQMEKADFGYLTSVFSYVQNLFFCQSEELLSSSQYLYYKKLHELTRIHSISSPLEGFIRVGNPGDGGYILAKPLSKEKIAYSFGISNDVSWDLQMAQEGYQIYQYDHTIEHLPEENDAFHWEKVGLTGEEETEELKHLDTVLKSNGHDQLEGMILKMDIEGYERAVLTNSSSDLLQRFDQIVFELHYTSEKDKYDEIIAALENLMKTHAVVHIHPNNYDYIVFCGDLATPYTLELTCVNRNKYSLCDGPTFVDSPLDRPNRAGLPDYLISRW